MHRSRPTNCYPFAVVGHGLVALFLGAVVSYCVTVCLWQAHNSEVFGDVLGVLLMAFGALIMLRAIKNARPGERCSMALILGFAGVVILSGIAAIALEFKSLHDMAKAKKVPAYAIMGMSITFAFTFAIVDVLNWFVLVRFRSTSWYDTPRLVIQTGNQITMLLVATLVLGLFFGFEFGTNGSGNAKDAKTTETLYTHLMVTAPVGAGVGFVLGIINEWFLRPYSDYPAAYKKEVAQDQDVA